MLTIYKYTIEPHDYYELQMPEGARILTVQEQKKSICLWALVDPKNKMVTKRFRIAGTGHLIKEDPASLVYIDTFQLMKGVLVFHLFGIISKKEA